jgi:hypothetical protein
MTAAVDTRVLWIPGKLPGLNDMLDAAKGSGGRGKDYSKLKRQWGEAIWAHALSAKIHKPGPFAGPVRLAFEWREKNRQRDPDNVAAAKKLVLDSLIMAKVLLGDGWKHIAGWEDTWLVDAERPGVLVTMRLAVEGGT